MPTLFHKPERGDTITIGYPKRNRHSKKPGKEHRKGRCQGLFLRKRRVQVLQLFDMTQSSIPLNAFFRRPYVRRGRWLCLAWDPIAMGEKFFYLDWDQPVKLQLGKVNPRTGCDWEDVGEPFEQTRKGIADLLAVVRKILESPPSLEEPTFAIRAAA
jgi:hypothetical protein